MAIVETITFHVPDEPAFLQAVAKVTICHAHVDYALRMCIKSLAGLELTEALDATELEGSSILRERIRKLGRARLGEGAPLLKLQALMKRCADLSARRNEITHHTIVTSEQFPVALHRLPDHSWQTLPSAVDVEKLANELAAIAIEINHARMGSWLALGLEARPLPLDS
jgi:hypothetical protein